MSRALIPGSFDPVTRGHESLVRRAAAVFDEVDVIVFINPDKKGTFSHRARVEMLSLCFADLPHVRVGFDDGMVADYVRREGITAIVKGIRNAADLAYEEDMARRNLAYCGVETLFLPAASDEQDISSTEVRRRLAEGEAPCELLPDAICDKITDFFRFSQNND